MNADNVEQDPCMVEFYLVGDPKGKLCFVNNPMLGEMLVGAATQEQANKLCIIMAEAVKKPMAVYHITVPLCLPTEDGRCLTVVAGTATKQ
jgi:hypothetical protein